MRKRIKAFTLVELLVVIGIIALLISILMPALTKARQAAMSVQCLSNLRQCAMGIRFYASDWRDEILISTTIQTGRSYSGQTGGHHTCWPRFYVQGRGLYDDPGSTQYIKSPQAVLCPAEFLYGQNVSDANRSNLSDAVAYGVYAPGYGELAPRKFNFVPSTKNPGGWTDAGVYVTYPPAIPSDPPTVLTALIYKGGLIRDPSRTILLADSIESYTNHNQVAEFKGSGTSFNNAAIHLIHSGRANVAFFDGHAESLLPRQLRYDTATAPDRFYLADPGPGYWDGAAVFQPPYQNIAYPAYPAP